MQPSLTLYTFRRCPYAMRARMALAYAGLEFEVREVILRDKPAEMLTLSPKGTVPVLLVGDRVIDESLDVMHFALAQNDRDGWLATSPETQGLIERCEQEFKPQLDRYKYHDRHPESQIHYRDQASGFLLELNQLLTTSDGPFFQGDKLCLVDVALFPFVRQFAHVDKVWFGDQPWGALSFWLQTLLDSRLFGSVMTKYRQWHAGDPPVYFQSR
ncbi:MAG: glutathione S-transferase [Pseudomonadota bacterium]